MERVNIGDKAKNKDSFDCIISTSQHLIREELEAAWRTLWAPFAEFPYVTVTDRSVVVAALLTAVMRRKLATAPAFCFVAPPACGKTLLASCIAELTGGKTTVTSNKLVPEDWFISAAQNGSRSILFDDIRGEFYSDILDTWLSKRFYTYHEPYKFEVSRVNTQMLTLIAGTNVTPCKRLEPRVLTVHLDPRMEQAERRRFRLDAKKYCREHQQHLISAALTLITGFVMAGFCRFTEDRLTSFEMWDDFIRQCVLWLNTVGIAELGDPVMTNNTCR